MDSEGRRSDGESAFVAATQGKSVISYGTGIPLWHATS